MGRARQKHGDENIKVYVRMRPLNATEHADAGAKTGHGGAHWALGLAGTSHQIGLQYGIPLQQDDSQLSSTSPLKRRKSCSEL